MNYSHELLVKTEKFDKLSSPFGKHTQNNITVGPLYDEHCEKFGDWASIRNVIYFKKSASFYFTDLHMIMLNTLQHYSKEDILDLNFDLVIKLNHHGTNFILTEKFYKYQHIKNTRYRSSYGYNLVIIDFNLEKLVLKNVNITQDDVIRLLEENQIQISLNIFDITLNETLNNPINLVVKSTRLFKDKRKKAIVCSKVIAIEKEYQIRNFQTWVELNRKLGYDKVIVYYEDIEMSQARRDYFEKNKDFVELKYLNCMPNILDSKEYPQKFLRNYTNNVDWVYHRLDTIAAFEQSECFLENIEKYEYVMAADSDEIGFIGLNFEEIAFNSPIFRSFLHNSTQYSIEDLMINPDKHDLYKFDLSKVDSTVDTYQNSVNIFTKRKNPHSILLDYKLFLGTYNLDKLCKELQETIEMNKQNLSLLFEKELLFQDLDDKILDEQDKVSYFTVRVLGREQFLYAFYLCEMNRRIVHPFIDLYSKQNPNFNTTFGRLFYLKIYNGKSLHDTRKVILYNTHNAEYSYEYKNESAVINRSWYDFDSYNLGFTGHFRFDPQIKYYYENFSDISNIALDLFYIKIFQNTFF